MRWQAGKGIQTMSSFFFSFCFSFFLSFLFEASLKHKRYERCKLFVGRNLRAIFEWLSFPLNESNYFLFSPFLLDSTGTNSGIERSDERNEGIVLRLFFPIASLEGVGRISNRSTTWLNKNPTQSYTDCRLNREHRLMMTV